MTTHFCVIREWLEATVTHLWCSHCCIPPKKPGLNFAPSHFVHMVAMPTQHCALVFFINLNVKPFLILYLINDKQYGCICCCAARAPPQIMSDFVEELRNMNVSHALQRLGRGFPWMLPQYYRVFLGATSISRDIYQVTTFYNALWGHISTDYNAICGGKKLLFQASITEDSSITQEKGVKSH